MIKEMGFPTIDPCDWNLPEQGTLEDCLTLVTKDKEALDQSSIVLVYPWKNSFGTSMEILYAYEREKKIITIWDRKDEPSPWIRVHCTKLVFNWKDAKQAIRELLK